MLAVVVDEPVVRAERVAGRGVQVGVEVEVERPRVAVGGREVDVEAVVALVVVRHLDGNDGDGNAGQFDDAPSGTGSWQYKFQETFDLVLAAGKASTAKAGGTWVIGIAATRSDTGKTVGSEATIACKATAGSAKLPISNRAFVSGGSGDASAAVCAFKVSKKLKKKVLHGTISISYKGQTVSKSFTTTVK